MIVFISLSLPPSFTLSQSFSHFLSLSPLNLTEIDAALVAVNSLSLLQVCCCCCCCCCCVISVVSDSVQPHRRQLTRLPRPWDSPGKNSGVGCHLLLQCMKVKSETELAQSCLTLSDPMDCSLPGSSVHGIFQARILEWGAIAFSGSQLVQVKSGFQPNHSHTRVH